MVQLTIADPHFRHPKLSGAPRLPTSVTATVPRKFALVRGKPPDFEPGTKFYYSNTNYILLGEIIEHVSGMPYADFLRQNILIPAGMTGTGVDVDFAILPERAQGYDSTPDGFRHADTISMTIRSRPDFSIRRLGIC